MSDDPKVFLAWGPNSTEYENSLVGNKAGLENFMTEIQAAIDTGENQQCAQDFVDMVCCKPDSFFENLDEDREPGLLGNVVFAIIFFSFLAFLIVGFVSTVTYLWRLFT